MYLTCEDIARWFPSKLGIQDDLSIYTVTDQAKVAQPKGLFIPLNEDSGELSEAIANGAIAAIWDEKVKVPHYTPNQFPIFFTEDLAEAINKLLSRYIEKLDGEIDNNMEITNFKFSKKKLLNKNKDTYDIAVMLKKVTQDSGNNSERRG